MSTTSVGLLRDGAYKGTYNAGTGAFEAFNDILKRYYEGPTRDLINSTRVLVRLLNRELPGISVAGSDITTSIRTQRNVGRKYSREGARLVTPGKQTYRQARWITRNNYGVAQFTGQAVSASRTSRGAFLNQMDAEINGLAEDLQHGEQRVLYSDGSGALARVQAKAVVGTSVLTLEHPGGIASQALGTQYIEEGMRICILKGAQETDPVYETASADWVQNNGGTVRSFTINSVNYAAGTITLNHNIDNEVSVNDYIYLARDTDIPSASFVDGDSNRGIEMNGLNSVIANTDPRLQRGGAVPVDKIPFQGFGNLSTQTETRWAAFINDNGGVPRAWDQNLLQQTMDGLAQSGNGVVKLWLTTHGIRRQFASQLIAQRRYPSSLDLGGGFRALSWNGIPMVVDKDCTRGTVFGIDPDVMAIAKESDWNFIDEDGRVLQRIEGYDAFNVTIRRYAELVCTARNRQCAVKDIIDV